MRKILQLLIFAPAAALAAEPRFSGEALPRFAAFKSGAVVARVGPGVRYPAKYSYSAKFQPVQIVNEYYGWYQIKDMDGEVSWVYRSHLLSSGYATPISNGSLMYKKAKLDSPVVAKADRGAVLFTDKCGAEFCQVRTIEDESYKGYMLKSELFGV